MPECPVGIRLVPNRDCYLVDKWGGANKRGQADETVRNIKAAWSRPTASREETAAAWGCDNGTRENGVVSRGDTTVGVGEEGDSEIESNTYYPALGLGN